MIIDVIAALEIEECTFGKNVRHRQNLCVAIRVIVPAGIGNIFVAIIRVCTAQVITFIVIIIDAITEIEITAEIEVDLRLGGNAFVPV